MKKAHLNKWRSEFYDEGMDLPADFSENGSPAARELTPSERQVSDISSTTNMNSGCLDLRMGTVKMKVEADDDSNGPLDLRTKIRNDDCSNNTTKDATEALDLRICNVVSLKDINPIPFCVPESLSDSDTTNLSAVDNEQSCANDTSSVVTQDSVSSETNPAIENTAPNKMLPIEIIEKFNLIRNLVIASNGIIPSNIDDPGGTKLEVAQEEIVETSPEDHDSGVSGEATNGYSYVLQTMKHGAFLFSSNMHLKL